MKSDVCIVKTSPECLKKDIERVLELVDLQALDPKKETLIKINGNCNKYYPGSNTSPWFLDALIRVLKDKDFANVRIIEGNLFEFTVENMLEKTLLGEVIRKNSVEYTNYEKLPRDRSGFPKLLAGKQLINAPVMHTHGFAKISVATKNLWGFLPVTRRHLHKQMYELLLVMHERFPCLTIVDGTVGMVGDSTRTGIPRRLDLVLAGWNTLVIDDVCAAVMGFQEEEIPLLVKAREKKMIPPFQVMGDFDAQTLPREDFSYTDTLERKVTRWLEGLSNPNILNALTSAFLHAPIVDWAYNRTRMVYNAYQFKNKTSAIFAGSWLDYEIATPYIDYSTKHE